jgi:hypothetical protein
MAEKFRYVDVPEYSAITADLANSSANISTELEAAKEAANFHIEKHQHMRRAEELMAEISRDIARLERMMPIKLLGRAKPAAEKSIIEFSARPMKPIMTESDRELIARSNRALQNLQKNLAELKSELGKA